MTRQPVWRSYAWRVAEYGFLLAGLVLLIPPYSSIGNEIVLSRRAVAASLLMVALSRLSAWHRKGPTTLLDVVLTVGAFLLFATGLSLRLSCQ